MAPPRPNIPATQGQANPGNMGAAMLDVRNALQLLQRALPNIPMGSTEWSAVHKCIGDLAKHAGEEAPASMLNQSALSLIRGRSQSPMSGQAAHMFPPGGGNAPPTPPAPAEAA